ncbi:MAG: phosphoglycerate kinase, partial [Patescibacteria group bacterium]
RSAAAELKDGEALLLENIRRDHGEEKNDPAFAKALASLGDAYVNDAFPVSHRAHASIVGVPALIPAYAGLQFMKEVEGLTPALAPESPSLAIIGGAKFATKEKLIHTLLTKYDKLFIGGAIVNDFFKAKGFEVGKSLVSNDKHIKELLDEPKLIIPTDVTVLGPSGQSDKDLGEVGKEDVIDDVGPKSIAALWPVIENAKTILWNGPMGRFEDDFTRATDELAMMVAKSRARSIVGGGDTLASIQKLKLMDKFTFVSTAGGAMLDFLANGTLPGIEALEASKNP